MQSKQQSSNICTELNHNQLTKNYYNRVVGNENEYVVYIRTRKKKENGVVAPRIPGGKPYTS